MFFFVIFLLLEFGEFFIEFFSDDCCTEASDMIFNQSFSSGDLLTVLVQSRVFFQFHIGFYNKCSCQLIQTAAQAMLL